VTSKLLPVPFRSEQEDSDYLQQVEKEIANYERRIRAVGAPVPEPKEEKNVLLTALDILDRPRNAVAVAVKHALDNEGDFWKGFVEGLTGREKVLGSEFVERAGVTNPVAKAAIGFALDVAADPLTYTGVPAAKALAQAVGRSVAATAVKSGLSALGEQLRVLPAARKLADLIGPYFSNRYVKYSSAADPEERMLLRESKEDIHRFMRRVYGLQVQAAENIWKEFKDIPEAARKVAPHVIEEPIRAVERLEKSSLARLEDRVRDAYGDEFDAVFGALRERFLGEMAKSKGKPLEEALEKLDPKRRSTLEKRAYIKALRQMARAAELVDAHGLEDIARRAAEAGVPVEEVERAASALKASFIRSALADLEAGVLFEPIPNYVFHMYADPPQKVRQAILDWRAAARAKAARMSAKGSFQYRRSIPTIEEAKKLGLHPIEDAAVLAAVREMEGIRARQIKEMYRYVLNLPRPFVVTADELSKEIARAEKAGDADAIRRLMNYRPVPSAHVPSNVLVHPEILQALERAQDVFVTTGGAKEFFAAWNKVQNMWKSLVTSIVPTFHIRNMFGNFYNNYLGGVTNPNHYLVALRILQGADAPFRIGKLEGNGQDILREFTEQGLAGFGFFRGETQTGMAEIMQEAMRGWRRPGGLLKAVATKEPYRHPVSYGRAVGDFIETWAKLTHYIAKRAQGLGPADAADSVRKYLFDYADITPLERVLRSFVPFYTFTRKNIPLQFETLITNPAKLARVVHLLDEAQRASGVDDVPEWLKEDLAIPISTTDEGYHRYLRLDFPTSQLAFVGTQGLKELLNMISPLVKVPFEVVTGRTVTGREISPYEGARGRYALPFIPGQKAGEPYRLPAWFDYAIQQFGGVPREIMEILTGLAGLQAAPLEGDLPAMARRASDVLITREEAPPPEAAGKVPPTLRQPPIIGAFWYRYDPRRQEVLDAIRRRAQLQAYARYLRDVLGVELPTTRELGGGARVPIV
jgi:hypothetical protein